MRHLLTIRESDIYPSKENLNTDGFKLRQAARAVVLNDKFNVALLRVNAYAYHKLPGGGVDPGEDMESALQRELLEEIGSRADITAEVGEIIEYRDNWQLKQISHCYLVKQTGKQMAPHFTKSEINEGFEIIWADTIEAAIALLEQDEPKNYDGLFIQRRDTQLLKTVRDLLMHQQNQRLP